MKNGDSNNRDEGCVKRLFMHQRERVDAETAADEWVDENDGTCREYSLH